MYIEGGYSGTFSAYTGGNRGIYMDSNARVVINGTSQPAGNTIELSVNGDIYGTTVYVGNTTQNYLFSYSGNMHIYSQAGTTITLGG